MATTPHDDTMAQELRAAGIREVLAPDDAGFAQTVLGFNLALTHRPEAVVVAHGTTDVAGAVAVAARRGARITVLGRGHGMLGPVEDGVLIVTRHLASVEVDETQRTARVSAGTTWQQVLDAVTPLGLAPLCGSAPHVGVIGYLLGGGLGPVARTFGFAADHVRSMEVVVGRGRVLTVDALHHSDLFWALRGGKTGLGVVTSATIDLFPVRTVFGGGVYFAAEDTEAVLTGFAELTVDLPESVSASVALLRLPPAPELPEFLRGRVVTHVRIAAVGDLDESARLVQPLRTLAEPLLDTVGELPYAALGSIHADPVAPMPFTDGGMLLAAFDSDTVAALLAVAGPDVPAPLAAIEVRVLGGAIGRPPVIPNAVGGRAAAYSLHVVGAPIPELLDGPVPSAIGELLAALLPWSAGGAQANFFGRSNDLGALAHCWPGRVAERLAIVRGLYDPAGIFRADGRRGADLHEPNPLQV